eukprot:TRINITY_DN13620_c0_g1_i5.p1 TRINITY_DN13620_c0_g1~~TRINITY_DN13620_c0_g1_i5.p1  ORF type:complete len:133 (-),score=28.14 TRINITY_DN13620_c0_g1_i5:96-494(-)
MAVFFQVLLAVGAIVGGFRWRAEHPLGTPSGQISGGTIFKWILFSHGSMTTISLLPGLSGMLLFHIFLAAADMTTLDWIAGSDATKKFSWSKAKLLLCSSTAIQECCAAGTSNVNKTCRKRNLVDSCNPFCL